MTCAVLITPLVDVVPIIEGCDYIGVDAGALKIIDQGLPIKMAVGDFDSLNEEDLKRITCPIERHPIMKGIQNLRFDYVKIMIRSICMVEYRAESIIQLPIFVWLCIVLIIWF